MITKTHIEQAGWDIIQIKVQTKNRIKALMQKEAIFGESYDEFLDKLIDKHYGSQ